MKLKGKTRIKVSLVGWFVFGCTLLPLSSFGALFPVTQSSLPAGLVSQSAIIEQGENYTSINPQLNKNGYTFGYWKINGTRQAGADGRSLTQVSTIIQGDSNFTAHYYGDNEDTDGDGVMDWFEYRMFGDLSRNPSDDSDGDGFSNKRESELGQDALIVDFMEPGGIAGRMSNTFTYADTSMSVVTIKSNPSGFITTSITNKELNASVSTQSLNGATNGSHFAYWTVNGVRQASPNGVASSKVTQNISGATEIIAHYVPSTEDTDGDGVMDWFELYQFGNLASGPEDDSDGDGFSNKREGELGQEATIAEFVEAGGIAGRMSNTFSYADTSMVLATITSNPKGFITESVTYKESNSTVTTQNLNGATNGSHFAYWTINGVRQFGPTGVSQSKVSATITADTIFTAHYIPSTEDTDADGVVDWFEMYQFGNLTQGPNDDPDGDGYSNKREGELGQEATIAEFVENGGIAGRMSNSVTYYLQVNNPPNALNLSSTNVHANKPTGELVGIFQPSDPDDSDNNQSYVISFLDGNGSTDRNKFSISGRNLLTTSSLSVGNYLINVRVSDDENASLDKNFTIQAIHDPNKDDDNDSLTYAQEQTLGTSDQNPDSDGDGFSDKAEISYGSNPLDSNSTNLPPNQILISRSSIQENLPAGTIVGIFSTYDPDQTDQITVSLLEGQGDDHNSKFTIDANKTLKTAASFNYDHNSSLTIRVVASDQKGATFEKIFSIKIGKDFRNINLNGLGVDFKNSDYRSSNFSGIRTESYADFSGANLKYADFSGGNKKQTKFINADLSNANFRGSDLKSANLSGADFNGTDFFGASFNSSTVWPSGFNPQTAKAFGPGIDFSDFNLTGFNQISGQLQNTNFEGVDLSGKRTEVADFSNSNFKNANLSGGNKKQTKFINTDLRGANLYGANITSSTFTGAVYDLNTIWPDGFDPVAAGALSRNPPRDLNSTAALAISENRQVGTVIGEFNATDPDANATLNYALVDGNGSTGNLFFNLDQNGTLKSAVVFDYENNESDFSIRAQVRDEHNASLEKTFVINLLNVIEDLDGDGIEDFYDPDDDNDGFSDSVEIAYGSDPRDGNSAANTPPASVTLSSLNFPENLAIGTLIGEYNATDADGDATTYHFVNGENNNSLFTLESNGTLKTATIFDYETNASNYTITVQAKDELNATTEGNFTVTLLDVNLSTPLIESNFMTAVNLWFSNQAVAKDNYGHISDWNTSEVMNMSNAFRDRTNFNEDISGWDVSKVTNMNHMFSNASSFNQAIGDWNVSSVTNMYFMFAGSSFNQLVENWDVSSVTNMAGMFADTPFNQPIADWNTSSVTKSYRMFRGATNFNQSIGAWDVSSITEMQEMFKYSSFNQPIGDWDVSSVTNFEGMFANTPFNKSIANWDVSSVTKMDWMFAGTTSFNQPIGDWNVTSVTNMTNMFNNTSALSDTNKGLIHQAFSNQSGWPYNWSAFIPNQAPSNLVLSQSQFSENLAIGSSIGTFSAFDPDTNDTLSYWLMGYSHPTNKLFSLQSTNGVLRTATIFDYESNASSYNLSVKAMDSSGASIEGNFSITLLNVIEDFDQDGIEDFYDPDDDNDGFSDAEEIAKGTDPFDDHSVPNAPPSSLTFTNLGFFENLSAGSIIGEFNATDPDANSTLAISFRDENGSKDNHLFIIDENDSLRTTRAFDYETDDWNYSIRVTVTDEHNLSIERTFAMPLLNIIEDFDGDGIEDFFDWDDDNDGFPDDYEIGYGSNPRDANSTANLVPDLLDFNGSAVEWNSTARTVVGKFAVNDPDVNASLSLQFVDTNDTDHDLFMIDGNYSLITTQAIPYERALPALLIHVMLSDEWNASIEKTFEIVVTAKPYIEDSNHSTDGNTTLPDDNLVVDGNQSFSAWWGIDQPDEQGWVSDSWLGTFRPYEHGWLYHLHFGWLYVSPSQNNSLWLWSPEHRWLWTRKEAFPFLYRWEDGTWLYALILENGTVYHFNYATDSYE